MRQFLALVLLALPACDSANEPQPRASIAPKSSPAKVEIVDLAALEGVLSQHRGRAVVLNLWAMW